MLNFCVYRHFYMVSLSTTSFTPSRDAHFFPQSRTGRGPPSSLHWRNFGAGNGREGVYLLVIWVLCSTPRVAVRYFRVPLWRKVQRQTICSDSIQFWSAKYLLWKAGTSGVNVLGHFLFVYFLFFKASFMLTHFLLAPFLIFPVHFFCFCNTCIFVKFRTSFGVAIPNIILLYIGMASKSIRYN